MEKLISYLTNQNEINHISDHLKGFYLIICLNNFETDSEL